MDNLSIVMPVYNEKESLPLILDEWLDFCDQNHCQLIVVNDGSTDGTYEILKSYQSTRPFTLIHHKVNKGYGGAIKTGIRAAQTEFLVTVDGDGQHRTESIVSMYHEMVDKDIDLLIGTREKEKSVTARGIGKWLIRTLSRALLPNNISDLNSGLKMYRTELAQRFVKVSPNSMAFSDIITLSFIAEKYKVMEIPILINPRAGGESKITFVSAFDTVIEIINIVVFFNPLRLFLPLSALFLLAGLAWGIPIVVQGRGVSTGSLLAFTISAIALLLGLIAEQLSQIRRMLIDA